MDYESSQESASEEDNGVQVYNAAVERSQSLRVKSQGVAGREITVREGGCCLETG